MENHKCTQEDIDTGQYISRHTAVCFVSVLKGENQTYVIAGKRGPDVEFPGKWSMLGGYLNYDEKLSEACAREFTEETGKFLKLLPSDLKSWKVDDNPSSEHQNITHYFYTDKKSRITQLINNARDPRLKYHGPNTFSDLNMLTLTNGEISEVKLIKIEEINNYDWAFGHFKVIMEYLQSGLL